MKSFILNEINNSIIQKNIKLIESELELSSENNLKYLSDIINSKTYFSDKRINIINAHIDFLKDEFFDIIHEIYQKKDQINVFDGSRAILENQIQKDVETINKIITDFDNKVKSLGKPKEVTLSDKIRRGTNYSIRETENIKEIQVLVQAGHLNDVIEQDF